MVEENVQLTKQPDEKLSVHNINQFIITRKELLEMMHSSAVEFNGKAAITPEDVEKWFVNKYRLHPRYH